MGLEAGAIEGIFGMARPSGWRDGGMKGFEVQLGWRR